MSPRNIGILGGLIVAVSMVWLNYADEDSYLYRGWPMMWSVLETKYPPLTNWIYGLALSVGAGFGLRNIAHRLSLTIHLTLRGMLGFTAASAIAFVLIRNAAKGSESGTEWVAVSLYYVDGMALDITLFALFPACIAIIDFIGWLWPRSRKTD